MFNPTQVNILSHLHSLFLVGRFLVVKLFLKLLAQLLLSLNLEIKSGNLIENPAFHLVKLIFEQFGVFTLNALVDLV